MTRSLMTAAALILCFAATPLLPGREALAQEAGPMAGFAPIADTTVRLDDFIWQKRPIVVFADTASDPAFIEQIETLRRGWSDLEARDVVVITDTDPDARGPVRTALPPRGFALVIIDKDGTVAQRKPLPWSVREISSAIDKMPIRREEIRNGTRSSGM